MRDNSVQSEFLPRSRLPVPVPPSTYSSLCPSSSLLLLLPLLFLRYPTSTNMFSESYGFIPPDNTDKKSYIFFRTDPGQTSTFGTPSSSPSLPPHPPSPFSPPPSSSSLLHPPPFYQAIRTPLSQPTIRGLSLSIPVVPFSSVVEVCTASTASVLAGTILFPSLLPPPLSLISTCI